MTLKKENRETGLDGPSDAQGPSKFTGVYLKRYVYLFTSFFEHNCLRKFIYILMNF